MTCRKRKLMHRLGVEPSLFVLPSDHGVSEGH